MSRHSLAYAKLQARNGQLKIKVARIKKLLEQSETERKKTQRKFEDQMLQTAEAKSLYDGAIETINQLNNEVIDLQGDNNLLEAQIASLNEQIMLLRNKGSEL